MLLPETSFVFVQIKRWGHFDQWICLTTSSECSLKRNNYFSRVICVLFPENSFIFVRTSKCVWICSTTSDCSLKKEQLLFPCYLCAVSRELVCFCENKKLGSFGLMNLFDHHLLFFKKGTITFPVLFACRFPKTRLFLWEQKAWVNRIDEFIWPPVIAH